MDGPVLMHDIAVTEAWTRAPEAHFGEVPVAGATCRAGRATAGHGERTDDFASVDDAQTARERGQHRIVPVGRSTMAVGFLSLPELHHAIGVHFEDGGGIG